MLSVRARTHLAAIHEVPEARLVRDLIYTFQGIDGTYIKFDAHADAYRVAADAGVTHSNRELCCRIAELGWLYRRVCAFINAAMERSGAVGLVEQSFCAALQVELTDYYRLIATLETQIVATLSEMAGTASSNAEGAAASSSSSSSSSASSSASTLTLKRLLIWVQEPVQKMRLMAVLADSAAGLRGGALASAIDSHLKHGDASVAAFVFRVMRQLCAPFFQLARRWLFAGVLDDPFAEFFVAADAAVPPERFWQDKYSLRREMVPAFIDEHVARKILLIGKSINFLRTCCHDSDWAPPLALARSAGLAYGEGAALEATVDEIAEVINQRVMDVLMHRYRLREHCAGLKKYILLSAGDFIQHLMDIVSPELEKRADKIFAHHMLGLVQQAVRASNAQFDAEDTLGRLSVRLLAKSHGELGWDVFALDYRVDLPISVVLHADALKHGYDRMFHFLWRLKRVDHVLGRAWQAHLSDRMHALNAEPKYRDVCRASNMLRFEMVHFVQSLLSYVMFEVLESSWDDLCRAFDSANGLDEIIAAHDAYLRQILERALIGGAGDTERTYRLLSQLLELVIKFAYHQDRIHETIAADLERRKKTEDAAYARTKANQWGITGQPSHSAHAQSRAGASLGGSEADIAWSRTELAALERTRDAFAALLDELLVSLDELNRRHVADVGYLVFRLVGTNQFYERRRQLAEVQAAASGTKAMRARAAELISAQVAALDSSMTMTMGVAAGAPGVGGANVAAMAGMAGMAGAGSAANRGSGGGAVSIASLAAAANASAPNQRR